MRVRHRRPTERLRIIRVHHLTATEIAAFIDRALPPDARHRAERHLAECSVCREEIAECARLAAVAPTLRSSGIIPWRWAGIAAAAMVGAMVFTVSRWRIDRSVADERARVSSPAIKTIFPATGGAEVSDLRFTWNTSGPDVTYRVVVTDTAGGLVWSADGADTSMAPPVTTLKAGERYFWHVEAMSPNGDVGQSAPQSFTVSK